MLQSHITGLGISELTRTADRTIGEIGVEAALLAIEDAELVRGDIDGLVVAHSPVGTCEPLGLSLQQHLGLGDLKLLQDIHAEGSSAMQMMHNAALYTSMGMARHVLCVWADAPLTPGQSSGTTYNVTVPHGHVDGWEAAHGLFGAASAYGLWHHARPSRRGRRHRPHLGCGESAGGDAYAAHVGRASCVATHRRSVPSAGLLVSRQRRSSVCRQRRHCRGGIIETARPDRGPGPGPPIQLSLRRCRARGRDRGGHRRRTSASDG
jgi:hypothetical protein